MSALKVIGIILVAIWMVLVLVLLAAPLAEAGDNFCGHPADIEEYQPGDIVLWMGEPCIDRNGDAVETGDLIVMTEAAWSQPDDADIMAAPDEYLYRGTLSEPSRPWWRTVLDFMLPPAGADEAAEPTDEAAGDQPGLVAQEAKAIELWVKRHIPVPSKLHIHEGVWCHYDEAQALHCKSTPPQAEGAKQ